MDRKLVISELAEGLAQRVKMPQKEAEAFVRHFFDEISDNLFLENIVKIKSFGTFKLMDVDARESVDIHTGSRIQIAEHTKVSFVPDAVLRDAVNKPFLEFETVILNEGTDVEAMMAVEDPVIQEEQSSNDVEISIGEAPVSVPPEKEVPIADKPIVEGPVEEEAAVVEGTIIEEPVTEEPAVENTIIEESVVEEPIAEESEVDETINLPSQMDPAPSLALPAGALDPSRTGRDVRESSSPHCFWHMMIACICALLFFIIGYTLGYLRPVALPFLEKQPMEKNVKQQPEKKPQIKPQQKAAKPATKAATPSDSAATARPIKPQPSEVLAYPQVEDGDYLIVGIKDTVVMKAGKTLLNISIQYYRSQDFVPYICKLNGITNPDIVPLDKELKIPELKHK